MSEEFGEFIARLTDNARISLQHAEAIARGQGSPYIGTEHLLLGVLAQGSSAGAKFLADAGVTLDRAQASLDTSQSSFVVGIDSNIKSLSETALLTLKMAYEHAKELHQEFLGTEHIVYTILKQNNARGTVLLRDMNSDVEEIISGLEDHFSQHVDTDRVVTVHEMKQVARRPSIVNTYGTNLTELARVGELDAVIGRDRETDRTITILSRRTKNNPLLIGEPGVGKTAIVEGLARRIAAEEVPDHLLDAEIVQLDLASMVAGTKYRGEFEERLKKVIREIRNSTNTIVFIDELHMLVGAGAAEGSLDAANIIKPALARGELRLIGATTYEEFRKHIEKDTALSRRFQTIPIKEPNVKDAISIIRGLKPYYEEHHDVVLSDELIKHAVYMADRYVFERYMPDKAIDVVDEAAATARVGARRRPGKLREYTKERQKLEEAIKDAVSKQDYERAALYKTRLHLIEEKINESKQKSRPRITLTESHVARAVAEMTDIPVEKLQRSEATMLRKLESHLGKSIIGQPEAISHVARSIRRSRSGIASKNRPIGSFIFMGPTGVGKTEMARVLAREVFGKDDALIKIDMSEFSERHTSSKLLGAPAGYVGYDEGGTLTEKVQRQPYSVILFDEIEKAHKDIFHLLLQILEDGVVRDGRGRLIDFTNTIVILTSNLGSDEMMRESQLGFSATTKQDELEVQSIHEANMQMTKKALKRFMRPELINRFDAVVTFRALSRRDVRKIVDHLLADLADRLMPQGITLSVSSSAKRLLIDRGYDSAHGARPLRRVIENEIEHYIAERLLRDGYAKGDIVTVAADKAKFVFGVKRESD